MEKKKVIFCMQTMVMGGVEKELLTILPRFDKDKYDITVLLFYVSDDSIVSGIPSWVKLINLNMDKDYYCSGIQTLVKKRIKKGKIIEASRIVFSKVFEKSHYVSAINMKNIKKLDEKYDIAVCYHIFSPIMFRYVAEYIKADKKIAWVHNDFKTTGYRLDKLKRYLDNYNKVVAVSKKLESEFKELCPFYTGDVSVAYNVIDVEGIKEKSKSVIDDDYFNDKFFKLLSVGRFDEQKGFDIAIESMNLIKGEGLDLKIHWYLIGEGKEENKYKELIKKYGLEYSFLILGRKDNPYPYIKNCDIYIQPSRHEGFGLVVAEAKVLTKPIICTDFDGADEQIQDGYNGSIVERNNPYKLKEEIIKLFNSPETRNNYIDNLKNKNPQEDYNVILSHFE